MIRKFLFVSALVALCFAADRADAVCRGGVCSRGINRGAAVNVNRGVNVGVRNFGLRQVVVGNQVVTLDRFGNVVDRSFVNRGRRNVSVNVGVLGRRRSLSDRLLFGF